MIVKYGIDKCKPCEKPEQYRALKNELEGLGYNLKITNKVNVIKPTRPTPKEIEKAKNILKRAGFFAHNLWHYDDIDEVCNQNHYRQSSTEEKAEVFDWLEHNHNADIVTGKQIGRAHV